jgi:hypothetical protein
MQYYKTIIKIQLGDNSNNTIDGYIDKTTNLTGAPRILGNKPLKLWIQKHYKQGDILKVDILSNVSIRLNEKRKTN